jgi:protein-disulfide isomerase/type II secretory pathway component PulC
LRSAPWCVALIVLAACGREDEVQGSSAVDERNAGPVAARIGGREITLAEMDAPIAGALHELEYERYRLRRETLESSLLRTLAEPNATERSAQILLQPPLPPSTELGGTPAAVRPEAEPRPVTVTVFCNFESPHCARAQGTLADLLALYPQSIRIAARDLPLPMHRLAAFGAEAARCAGGQGRYWAFHDLVWARGHAPDRDELDRVALAVGLDRGKFQRCIDTHETAGEVAADVALAKRLGLGMVPAIFVNGRRATAPVTVDQLVWLVAVETAAATTPPAPEEPRTSLPLHLRAALVGARPGLGLALIAADGHARVVREGERVTSGAILRRVSAQGAELLVEGRREHLDFAAPPARPRATRKNQLEPADPSEAAPMARAGPGGMPVYLDREVVRERMADRVALSRVLEPVTMTVDGYRLLRLGTVPPGSLYELLGLQPGDVIVAVNEQPIHEGDNPMWDALDREPEVRVRVMRRGGLAQHYTYRFQ